MQYYKTYELKPRSMKAETVNYHRLENKGRYQLFNKGKIESVILEYYTKCFREKKHIRKAERQE